MFPPVSSYRRFLIHKTCEQLRAAHPELATFSIGQGSFRRTVVCLEQCLLSADGARGECAPSRSGAERTRNSWRSGVSSEVCASNGHGKSIRSNGQRTSGEQELGAQDAPVAVNRTLPIQLYRPPGARRSLSLAEETSCSAPDYEVTTKAHPNSESKTTTAVGANGGPASLSASDHQSPPKHLRLSATDAQKTTEQLPVTAEPECVNHSANLSDSVCADTNESITNRTPTTAARPRRPDRAVYVPRARRSQTTPPASTVVSPASASHAQKPSDHHNSPCGPTDIVAVAAAASRSSPSSPASKPTASSARALVFPSSSSHTSPSVSDSPTSHPTANGLTRINGANCDTSNRSRPPIDPLEDDPTIMHRNNALNKVTTTAVGAGLRIEDAQYNAKDDKDEKELQRASKEINRSNRRLMKQTFASNVLEISDPIPKPTRKHTPRPAEPPIAQSPPKKVTVEPSPVAAVPPPAKPAPQVDPETDDWESIFDENGDCLDPKLIEEITASVGKVTIETPKSDYKLFHSKQALLNAEEFPHVLEVSGFPVEFKTPDLMMLFSAYKGSGFDIKWVDDTHALAVFSSSKIAAEVLSTNHPFVVLKTLTEATVESRSRAKKCANSLQPYRQRPETCAALARRLVTGALGVRLKTSTEERENERRVLREAKERKLLAAKQRDEAWES